MAIEIERKFLVSAQQWHLLGSSENIRQGYLSRGEAATARARVAGKKGYLTVKGKTMGISRPEFEYEIPLEDAEALLRLCRQPLIEKVRYFIPYAKHMWEVDVFMGENAGLVTAEVELNSVDEELILPPWVTQEVTGDSRYSNASLVSKPYSQWEEVSHTI